jgi:hypothetical protein
MPNKFTDYSLHLTLAGIVPSNLTSGKGPEVLVD